MNDIEYLRGFSLNEIASKTHLDEAAIKAIIYKDYESLKHANITMNIKILEREYDVDFSEWVNEFNEYKANNFSNDKKGLKVKPKIISYNSTNERKDSFLIYTGLSIVVLIALISGAYYYFTYKYSANTSVSNESVTLTNTSDIKQKITTAKESLPNKEKQTQEKEEIKQEENVNINSTPANDQKPNPLTPSKEENPQNNETKENNDEVKQEDINQEELSQDDKTKEPKSIEEPAKEEYKLSLTPKKKIWISAKDLATKETKNYLLERGVVFDSDYLIFIGNSDYSLKLNDKIIEIPSGNTARYILFKDNKIEFLSPEKYKKLDKEK